MRHVTIYRFNLFISAVLIAPFLCLSAESNMLPPRLTGYSSTSLTTANAEDARLFRVDQASLTVQCQRDCKVEVEYKISSRQPTEEVLVFILPKRVSPEISINGISVPVSIISEINLKELGLREHLVPESDIFRHLVVSLENPEKRLSSAAFKAPLSSGSNTIRVKYRQSYNRDKYEYKNAAGYWSAVREFRYEFWPLKNWYLSDSFKMSVNAEFTVTSPKEEELLVSSSGWPQSLSSGIERFESSGSTIFFQKEWKHNFPGRVLWFIGAKDKLDVSKGFVQTSIGR